MVCNVGVSQILITHFGNKFLINFWWLGKNGAYYKPLPHLYFGLGFAGFVRQQCFIKNFAKQTNVVYSGII